MSSATINNPGGNSDADAPVPGPMPAPATSSIMGRLRLGTLWLGLKTPASVLTALWSTPLTLAYIGDATNDAYLFAWNYGFVQAVLEFGMGSALQKQMTDAYTRGDRAAVDRTIACGMNFYAVVALIQVGVLLAVLYGGLPARYQGNSLVLSILWVQILTTPFYGLSAVVGSVLQAAQRYAFIPRLEFLIILTRFGLLVLGYATGMPFLAVVVAQVAVQIGFSLVPALVVMVRDLGHVPHFGGVRRADFALILNISVYMALLQWSVVLADRVDITMLGYVLQGGAEATGRGITIYNNVSKPFFQIRQTGWALVYLVMPAAVALAVRGDKVGLERIKYDGTRCLVALLVPPILLAGIYAAPFLHLWVGARFVPYAGLLRLFLVGTLPLILAAIAQVAIGMGHIRPIALLSLAGSLVNLPLSYVLTRRLGVAGVIWGSVLTTVLTNFLIPMLILFPRLGIGYRAFARRALLAPATGALALILACAALRLVLSPDPDDTRQVVGRVAPFLLHLTVGCLAYLAGYAAVSEGRGDLAALARRLPWLRMPRADGTPA